VEAKLKGWQVNYLEAATGHSCLADWRTHGTICDSPIIQRGSKSMLKFFVDSEKGTSKCSTQTTWKDAQLREVLTLSSFSKLMRNIHVRF